jgi:thiamine biosynthesis lipoprotein
VTVQPLWRLYETVFWAPSEDRDDIEARALDVARTVVDYRNIDAGRKRIAFTRPDMSMTLNSVAQGYLTDRVADMLRTEGFEHVYVDLGEIRALGTNPAGEPWHIGIRDARKSASIERSIDVVDEAVSVSGGYGTVFEPTGRYNHIFDPATGLSPARMLDVTVIGPRARDADSLSTAIYVAGEERTPALLGAYPGNRAIVTRPDGSAVTITAAGPIEA